MAVTAASTLCAATKTSCVAREGGAGGLLPPPQAQQFISGAPKMEPIAL